MKLPSEPTKQQEIDCFRDFVEALPKNSYLYSMFAHAPSMVEQMIRNDWAFDPIPELRRQLEQTRQDNLALEQQRKKLQEEVKTLEAQANQATRATTRARQELAEIRQQALRLSQS